MNRILKEGKSVALILGGNFLYALGVKLFLEPIDLVTGGVTGIGLALASVTGHPLSAFVFIANVLLLLLGLVFLGKRFAVSTLLSTFSYPVFLAFLEQTMGNFILTDDLILCTLFGGIVIGVALGVVIREGSSTGGMDVPPLILQKYFRIPVSVSMYAFDFVIIAAQFAVFPKEKILYGIVNMLIYTIVLDKMIMIGTSRTEIKVISTHEEEIREAILKRADRGVTILHGEGGYLRNSSEIVMSVISNRELPAVEKMIHAIDPEAFMIVSRVSEVSGHGFTLNKEYK